MKLKFVLLALLLIFLFPAFATAAPAKWGRPQCIKTYIPPKHKNTKLMKQAFEKWSNATDNKIKFYYVHTPKIAQIRVEFHDLNPYNEWASASQETYVRRDKKLRALLYISTETYTGKKLSKKEIFNTMLHEIGHCLGLPHTMNKLSVMHPTTNATQDIMETDINRLKMLYNIKIR